MAESYIPRDLLTLLYVALATSLGWLGGWLARRKREPVEIAKLQAEIRQIDTSTNVSLIQAVTTAISKVERLQSERDHWEQKAADLVVDLADLRDEHRQLETRHRLQQGQLDKAMALLKYHGISYAELDEPE